MSDDIVTRCKDCFNQATYCTCPNHQQVNDRRRAVDARKNLRCAMVSGYGLSGASIHPDYCKWWEANGSPNSKQLSDIITKSQQILDDYMDKYGEGR